MSSKVKSILTGRTILITGGAGFIGSHLVERLVDKNKLIIYDNFQRDSIKYLNVKNRDLRVIRGDILDASRLEEAMKDVEVVFHLAAVAGISTVTKSPVTTMKINLLGTYNLLEAARKVESVERIVYSSTSEVYGPHVFLGKESDMTSQGPVYEPRWTYATSKLAAEHFCHSYYLEERLPVTIIRYFNVYGPRQTGESAMHNFIEAAVKDEPLKVYGDGLQVRAWCYIDDAVDGTLLCATEGEALGKVINIGNPKTAITISSLASEVVRVLGSKARIVYVEKHFADVDLRMPDISLAERLLGYKPQVGLIEGITRTGEWYRSNPRGQ